jgi:hypothetical protein
MEIKSIEKLAIKYTVTTLIGLPITLFGMLLPVFLTLVPDGIKKRPDLQVSLAGILYLLIVVAMLVTYIIFLKHRFKEKPDFSQFIHDPAGSTKLLTNVFVKRARQRAN